MTPRQEAEAIEEFGEALRRLDRAFCNGFSNSTVDRVCAAAPDQDKLEIVAKQLIALGELMSRECDEAEEADDLRRANPLERDFRRLGQ